MREIDLDLSLVDLSKARMLTAFGRTQSLCDWAAETGIAINTIRLRLKYGHTPETAVTPRRPCKAQRVQNGGGKPAGTPGAASWSTLEWEVDPYAQRVVAEFRRLTQHAVGALFGMTLSRVGQIENAALAKLRVAIDLIDLLGPVRASEVLDQLRGRSLSAYEARLEAVQKEIP